MSEQRARPAVVEFLSGLFSGIGIILLTLLLVILAAGTLERFWPFRDNEAHFIAVLWTVLAFGMGVFIFRRRAPEHRGSSFTAGLVTAAALFLLLDSACWNFSFG
jgi:hypothetical protein